MDLMRLDENYIPIKPIIEGYTSLIWTERFDTPGEFVLKTPDVARTKKLLPKGTLVTHRETEEVFIVEQREITKNEEGFPELTVTGRSMTSFAENRHLEGAYPKKKYKMARLYTCAEATSVLLWNAFVNPSINDVTRISEDMDGRTLLDNIPNVVVTDSTTVNDTAKRRWLTGGQVHTQMYDIMRLKKLGIRMVRPTPDSATSRVVSVSTGDKGIISYDVRNTGKLRFDVYNGVNRTREQTARKPVIFAVSGDYLTDESYLWSIKDYITMVFVVTGVGNKKYYRDRANDAGLAGLDRRVLWVDGGEPQLKDIPDEPGTNQNPPTAAQMSDWRDKRDKIREENAVVKGEFLEDLKDKADAELDKHDQIELFDAKVSDFAPQQYKKDYFLGDLATVIGDYDFERTMRIVEYVRTEDATGDVGYPGFATSTDT